MNPTRQDDKIVCKSTYDGNGPPSAMQPSPPTTVRGRSFDVLQRGQNNVTMVTNAWPVGVVLSSKHK